MKNEIEKHIEKLGINKFIKENRLKLLVCIHANCMLWECPGGHLWNIQMIKDATNKNL